MRGWRTRRTWRPAVGSFVRLTYGNFLRKYAHLGDLCCLCRQIFFTLSLERRNLLVDGCGVHRANVPTIFQARSATGLRPQAAVTYKSFPTNGLTSGLGGETEGAAATSVGTSATSAARESGKRMTSELTVQQAGEAATRSTVRSYPTVATVL